MICDQRKLKGSHGGHCMERQDIDLVGGLSEILEFLQILATMRKNLSGAVTVYGAL